jgi:small GTP-binding protein
VFSWEWKTAPFDGKFTATAKGTWEQDGALLVFSDSRRLLAFDTKTWKLVRELRPVERGEIIACSISRSMMAVSDFRSIKIFDFTSNELLYAIEAHTELVTALAFSSCGRFLASKSRDYTVKIWRTDTWTSVGDFYEAHLSGFPSLVSFHPKTPLLATFGRSGESLVRLWKLDPQVLLNLPGATNELRYTTARVVLVGDSGVGKTGLGWRVATGEFREHPSTHGQQFWHVDSLGTLRSDGVQCQVVLWDLAGQPDYRIVHSLFLEDIDLALIVFDPTHPRDPLSAVAYWLGQIQSQEHRNPSSVLVAARVDRGVPTITNDQLAGFCREKGIEGGVVATSALTGEGVRALTDIIKRSIKWDKLPTTVTTRTFHRIKEFILGLKQETKRKGLLVGLLELRKRLEGQDTAWEFSDAEMITAIRHLASHGYVHAVESLEGEQYILLAPDLLSNLAASVVMRARANERGLGALDEVKVREDGTVFQDMEFLTGAERKILIDAVLSQLMKRNVCFREPAGKSSLLIFPSLINLRRPQTSGEEVVETVSYTVQGSIENVYASLVVLLGYSDMFTRKNQWHSQASYTLDETELCGFRKSEEDGGMVEFVLQFGKATTESTQLLFQGLFERLLAKREVGVIRYQPVRCSACKEQLPMSVVRERLGRKADFSFCSECGAKLALPSPEPITVLPLEKRQRVRFAEAQASRRTDFEAALVRIKSLLRSRAKGGE